MKPIKCEDRMPDRGQDVLVFCPEYPDEWFIATYLNPSQVFGRPMFYESINGMYYDPERITHWCPMPELPNKED